MLKELIIKGDLDSVKKLYITSPSIFYEVTEDIIIDTCKNFGDLPFEKMSIYGGHLRQQFKTWRYIIERMNRECSELELSAILNVINSLYKDINWTHPFWKKISINTNINKYARTWILSKIK